jgi:hypothetical protein
MLCCVVLHVVLCCVACCVVLHVVLCCMLLLFVACFVNMGVIRYPVGNLQTKLF